ncbi:MAG TPA: UDP-2,3-diacylglucosamine diphosphatase [Solimonas sp.]|nr:UDP-2,3-diacylglucosamine diphosphatase [Solimonas sp.]
MNRPAQTTTKHRTLWISDVHLGSTGCQAEKLTAFLKQNDCERLYLVGDIVDGWKMKSQFYWTPSHSRVIRALISKARRGTKLYYLTGNHDGFMRQFVRRHLRFGKVHLANEVVHETADGRRLLVMHGDAFDDIVSDYLWLAYAGDFSYEMLMRSNVWLNRVRSGLGLPYWSVSNYVKTQVKSAVQYLSGFDDRLYYRCQRDKLHGMITGHTHHAETRYVRNGVMSYNCGDWVESCTALAEDFEGNIEILHADDAARSAGAVAGPQPLKLPRRLPPPLRKVAARMRRRTRARIQRSKIPSP